MRYKQIFTVLLFFAMASSFSQETQKYLEKAVSSKASSIFYFKVAKKAIKSQNDLAFYNSAKSLYFTNLNELDSAIVYGTSAIKMLKKSTAANELFDLYLDVSDGYRKQGEYDKAIDLVLEGLKLAELKKNYFLMAKFNMRLSLNYHDFESYKKGVFYGKKAFSYIQISKQKDVMVLARIINSIAINYDDWNKPDSALYYHYKVFDYVKGNDTLLISRTYNNIGNTLLKQKKYLEARKWVKIGVSITDKNFKNLKNESELDTYYYEQATHYNNLATIAYQLSEFSEAEKLFDKSFYFATKSKNAEKMRDYYQHRYLFNRKRNNLKETAKYQEKYITLRDSVFDIERAANFAELETKYQTEKKEKELLKSKNTNIQNQLLIKEKTNQFIIASLVAFGFLIISFLIYRQQKLKSAQQEKEFELKSAIATIENQNKLQEQRLSISRDLHDNIGSQLTFIISSVDNIKYAFDITNEKLDNKLSNISSFAKDTIIELRDTIWAMNSTEITFEDLENRINNYIEKAKEAAGQISFIVGIDDALKTQKLTSVQGMNVYRTIQEAVNNSIKYANPSVITINARQIENQLKITIQDNGIGFDKKTVAKGNGLKNMQKRIEEIGGEYHLSSSEEGTRIEILLKNNEI